MSSFVSPRRLEAKQVLNSPFGISGQLLLGGDFNNSVFRLCLLSLFEYFPSIKATFRTSCSYQALGITLSFILL